MATAILAEDERPKPVTTVINHTVLKLKLDLDEEQVQTLERIGELCRVGRNAGLENWLLRQRGLPESDRQRNRLNRRTYEPKPGKPPREDAGKTESTKIYHAVLEAVPQLGTTQASMLAMAIGSSLSARVDWRREGAVTQVDGKIKRRRRKDDILTYLDRPPFFSKLEIPLHNRHTRVHFTDHLTITVHRPTRDIMDLILPISIRKMPPGKQAILRRIADGRMKLQDSKLVQKEDGWFWHVPASFEYELRSDLQAHLWPVIGTDRSGRRTDRPFRFDWPAADNTEAGSWFIGDGSYLLAQTKRLIELRKAIGWRYRQRMGAGHGRKKIDAAVRRRRQQEKNMRNEVRRRAIADIVRQCVRSNVGVLIYHEPSLPVREHCWFKAVGLDWDWTRFGADLANAAAGQRIQVVVEMLRMRDLPRDGEAEAG